MTTAGGIIIWTLILFVLVASQDTVLRGEEGAVCNFNVTETKTQKVWNCEECEEYSLPWFYWCGNDRCGKKNRKFITFREEQQCCDGYENKNSICEPQCSPECEDDRYCAKPNKCHECFPGWAGRNCNESLWCVVRLNLTITLSNLSVEVLHDNSSTEWKRPDCLPKCRDQVSNLSVNITKSKNMHISLVPIESPCNTEADIQDALVTFKYPITWLLGIVLLAIIVFGIVCVARRKQKPSITMDVEPAESGYEYACDLRPPSGEPTECEYNYVYDHRRLPGEPKKPEYDDVGDHQRLPEEPTKLEYDYVYNHRL